MSRIKDYKLLVFGSIYQSFAPGVSDLALLPAHPQLMQIKHFLTTETVLSPKYFCLKIVYVWAMDFAMLTLKTNS